MLEAILADREGRSVGAIAAEIGLPRATAHRQVTTLLAESFLARLPSGQLAAGPRLLGLLQLVDEKQLIVAAAAPVLHRLAAKVRSVVQLGTLENDMVTYRIKTGYGAGDLFTKIGLQLEAYCTGIGKVLLAHLPGPEREAYLAAGPFPPLTENTITDPARLRAELDRILSEGFARDCEEIVMGLSCLAVPILGGDNRVAAAISVSQPVGSPGIPEAEVLRLLKEASRDIGLAVSDPARPSSSD